jgi:hypothetical protein
MSNEPRDIIESFRGLPQGWDSYGGAAIEDDVVDRALRVLDVLVSGYTFWPVPCSDGGISLEGHGEWDGVDIKVEA